MIRRLETWSPDVRGVCAQDVFGTRTAGYYRCYGTQRADVSFYAQYMDGRCVGVLSDAFGDAALTVTSDSDTDEWSSLLRFLSPRTLLCDRRAAQRLGADDTDSGFVMRYFRTERVPTCNPIDPSHPDFSYREVYELLCECGFTLGEYRVWLGDLALRVNHGVSKVLCVREDSALSTASVLFDSGDAVYLGAVATHPDARGRGFAGDLVLRLAQCGKRAQILCRAHRVSFYASLGFRKNGEFSICHFSK